MGDKSPQSNRKQAGQKKSKADATQKKKKDADAVKQAEKNKK